MDFDQKTFETWLVMHQATATCGFVGQPSGCVMHSFLNDLPGQSADDVSGTYWIDLIGAMHSMPTWATQAVKCFDHFGATGTPVTFGMFRAIWIGAHEAMKETVKT